MVKARISKELKNKWSKFDDGSKELNNNKGFRWIEVMFKFNQEMTKYELYDYVMCFEMYLNDRELYNDSTCYGLLKNYVSCAISIKENEISKFNKIYFDFKSDYINIMTNYINEAKKGSNL